MTKIVDFYTGKELDPIDGELTPEVLAYVNRRSEEISSNFCMDVNYRLCSRNTNGVLDVDSLRYLVKRAIVEGIKWKENEII